MDFVFSYSLFIFQNTLLIYVSAILAFLYFKYRVNDAIEFVLIFSLCLLGLIIVPQIILGVFGALNFLALFFVHLLITVFVFLRWGRGIWAKLNFRVEPSSKLEVKTFLLFFLPIAILVLIRFVNTFAQIPLEYDNLAYHLPFVAEWFNTGSIMPHYYSAFAGPLSYYPSNFELLDLYVTLPFGHDYLVNFINYPFVILVGMAFYAILRRIKVKSLIGMAFTALFLAMPVIMRQIGVPLVDLMFTYTFLLSVYFLIAFLDQRKPTALIPLAFSIGLFAGTKYLGLVYGFPLVLIVLIYFLKWFGNNKKLLIRYSLLFIFFTILGGGFWYIRNLLSIGNPIFPVELKVFGEEILMGYGPISENLLPFSLLANVINFESLKFFVERFSLMVGLQGIFLPFAFLLILPLGFVQLFKNAHSKHEAIKNSRTFVVAGFLFILQVIYFYLYFRAPYSFNNLIPNVRYALMYLAISFISIAFILSFLKSFKKVILAGLFILLLGSLYCSVLLPSELILNNDKILFDFEQFVTTAWPIYLIFVGLIAAWIFTVLKILHRRKLKIKHAFFVNSFLIFILGMGLFYQLSSNIDQQDRKNLYEAWYGEYPEWHNLLKAAEWFNEADSGRRNANIAYTGFNFHYPLYGRNLQRKVDYVNINDCLNCRYREYALEGESIRRDPNYQNWLANLTHLGKEYVVVEPKITEGVRSYEFEWMQENKEKFSIVFNEGDTYIFKIL